jgi:mRNA interferase RelE/StbE
VVTVLLTPDGQRDFDELPATIQARVLRVIERLRDWPEISGAKPLRKEWSGHHRIRTGDWRIVFRVVTPKLIVVRIQHRSAVYED